MKRIVVLSVIFAQFFCAPHFVLCASITITENQGIDFGNILSGTGQSCVMDALSGSLTGTACYGMSGTRGVLLLNGDPSRMVDMEVIPGAVSNSLTFTPRFEGGGMIRSVSLGGTGSILVYIGGILETDPVTEPLSGPVTLTYTLRVNYQ